MSVRYEDIKVSNDILSIVSEEVNRIKAMSPGREIEDIVRLEKLSKVYALLMSSTRENIKSGVLGKMSTEELEKFDADDTDTED